MPSIYGKLFKRRETETRRPLEDFLTEALADVLNRAPRKEVVSFVGAYFLPRTADANSEWEKFNASTEAKRLRWSTQRRTTCGKFVDLLLEAGDDGDAGSWRKVLVVENKVMSGLSRHSVEEFEGAADRSESSRDQLATYGSWLAAQVAQDPFGWDGAIALLTHACPAPVGFGQRDRATYGVPWQRTCAWHQVWRWLFNKAATASAAGAPSWQVLAGELAEFIMENGMASETMTPHDLVVAEVYAPSADRMHASFRRVRMKLKAFRKDVANREQSSGAEFDASLGIIWEWGYLAAPYRPSPQHRWYVAWGIRFATIATRWTSAEPPLPGAAHAFVVLEADEDVRHTAFLERDAIPAGWSTAREGSLIAAHPMHEFGSSAPDEMTDAWVEWVAARTDELTLLLTSLNRQRA